MLPETLIAESDFPVLTGMPVVAMVPPHFGDQGTALNHQFELDG